MPVGSQPQGLTDNLVVVPENRFHMGWGTLILQTSPWKPGPLWLSEMTWEQPSSLSARATLGLTCRSRWAWGSVWGAAAPAMNALPCGPGGMGAAPQTGGRRGPQEGTSRGQRERERVRKHSQRRPPSASTQGLSEAGPRAQGYLLGSCGEWELRLGGRQVQLRGALQAGGRLAPHWELAHLLGPGEEETEGQGGGGRPWDSPRAGQPTRGHLHWLRGWIRGPGPACLGGPCQGGCGAGDLGWLPRVGRRPQPRLLWEGGTERPLGWRNGAVARMAKDRATPHPQDRAQWQTLAKSLCGGVVVKSGVPTCCVTLGQPQFPHLYLSYWHYLLPTYEVVVRVK